MRIKYPKPFFFGSMAKKVKILNVHKASDPKKFQRDFFSALSADHSYDRLVRDLDMTARIKYKCRSVSDDSAYVSVHITDQSGIYGGFIHVYGWED